MSNGTSNGTARGSGAGLGAGLGAGRLLGVLLLAGVLLSVGAPAAWAAAPPELLWDANAATANITEGAGTGAWNAANQWYRLDISPGANYTWTGSENVRFGVFGTGGTVNTGGNLTVGKMTFNQFGTAYTITSAAPQVLTLNNGGLTVNMNAFGGALTLGSANLSISLGSLGDSQTWTNDDDTIVTVAGGVTGTAAALATQTLTFAGKSFNLYTNAQIGGTVVSGIIGDGAVGGRLALSKTGTGSLILSAPNTYTGGFTLSDGVVVLTNAAGFGTGTLTLSGGDVHSSGGAITATNPVTVNGNAAFGVNNYTATTAPQALTLSGAMDLGASTRIFNVFNTSNRHLQRHPQQRRVDQGRAVPPLQLDGRQQPRPHR